VARPLDDLEARVERLGPDGGRSRGEVLFLHGAWHGAWYWEDLAGPVARAGFGVNLLDLPGHGRDPWRLPASTGLRDYALVAARAAAGLGRPVLVGHSMGGWLVQKLLEVADLPAVLLAPLPGGGLPWLGLVRLMAACPLRMLKALAGAGMSPADARLYLRMGLAPGEELPPARLEAILRNLAPEPARVLLDMGLGLARARPAPGGSPRLLVAAEHDFFMPLGAMRGLARRLGARLEVLSGVGHNLWLTDGGRRVVPLLLEFLEGACPSQGG